MNDPRTLLEYGYYGDELDDLEAGTSQTRLAFRSLLPSLPDDLNVVNRVVDEHFRPARPVFDGQITAGDGWFIGAFMSAVRPRAMIEIGVASGYSSAFILTMARELGLLGDETYLHSFDIRREHPGGHITGSLLHDQFPGLLPHWRLTTEVTAAVLDPDALAAMLPDGPVVAFIDGGHNHPWPTVDLTFLRRVPQCEWALLQDTQMMERWISDAVIYQKPVPKPVRGVQVAVSHWPGQKIIGFGMCYNMASASLRISREEEENFIAKMLAYPNETLSSAEAAACHAHFARLEGSVSRS